MREEDAQTPEAHRRIGGRLVEARRAAGLTDRQLGEATRITAELLCAIEDGRFDLCGGDVYARGHIRAYARAVGLDPQELLAEYGAVTLPPLTKRDLRKPRFAEYGAQPAPGAQPAQPARPAQGPGGRRTRKRGKTPDRPAGEPARSVQPTIVPGAEPSLVPMAGAQPPPDLPPLRSRRREDFTDVDAGSAAALLEPGVGPAVNARPAAFLAGSRDRSKAGPNWSLALVGAVGAIGLIAAVQLWPDGAAHAAQSTATPHPRASASAPAKPVAAPGPAKQTAPVDVKIAAKGKSSWVGVTNAAGQQLFSDVLNPGQSQEFTDATQLNVAVGDAAAVDLIVNGKDLGTPNSAGGPFQAQFVPGVPQQIAPQAAGQPGSAPQGGSGGSGSSGGTTQGGSGQSDPGQGGSGQSASGQGGSGQSGSGQGSGQGSSGQGGSGQGGSGQGGSGQGGSGQGGSGQGGSGQSGSGQGTSGQGGGGQDGSGQGDQQSQSQNQDSTSGQQGSTQ